MKLEATKKELKTIKKIEAITDIRMQMKELTNARVYARVETVAQSGMSRTINFYITNANGIYRITQYIATILDLNLSNTGHNGLRVSGGGMDMIFKVIYDLNRTVAQLEKATNFSAYNYLFNTSYFTL